MTPHDADRRDPLRRAGMLALGALLLVLLAGAVLAAETTPACGPEERVFVELGQWGWRPPTILEPLGARRWREEWRHRDYPLDQPGLVVINQPGQSGRIRCVLPADPYYEAEQ